MTQPQEEDELERILYACQHAPYVNSTIHIKVDSMAHSKARDDAKTALLEWRNTYARAYAKKVGLRAVQEDKQ